jgi:hypothetical protein
MRQRLARAGTDRAGSGLEITLRGFFAVIPSEARDPTLRDKITQTWATLNRTEGYRA